MHFFFANALRCRHFPNFPPDIFLKTQRHLFVVRLKDQKNSVFERFLFCFICKLLFTETYIATHVCFHFSISVIIHYQNIDRLEILRRTKASGHTIVLPQENHQSKGLMTRIVSQHLQIAKQLTATTSTNKTAMSQTIVDNRMRYAI